jgi:hypothetical protein
VERNGMRLAGADSDEATIPEMEDLYEELCDGTCICTLASFYRPNELSLQGSGSIWHSCHGKRLKLLEIVFTEIRFKDQMSVADCRFNLELLKSVAQWEWHKNANNSPFPPHFEGVSAPPTCPGTPSTSPSTTCSTCTSRCSPT